MCRLRKNQYGDSFQPTPSSKRQTSFVIDFLAKQLPYSLSAQDSQGRNCAHYASASSLAMNKIALIEKKCPESFTVATKGHGCPIHYACTHGADVEVVGHLLSRFSSRLVTVEHPYLGSPIACARNFNSFGFLLSVYSTIVNNSSDGTAFHKLMLDDNIKVKNHIIERFIEFSKLEPRTEDFQEDIWTKDRKTGTYPLHLVSGVAFRTLIDSVKPEIRSHLLERNVQLLEELIDCYPRALEEVDNRGWLPLHHAVRHNAPLKMIQLLIERYPSGVHVSDKQGSTILHIAFRYDLPYKEVLYLRGKLCEAAAVVVDKNGATPAHIACRHGAPLGKFKLFNVSLASSWSMQDNSGELPLHKACRGGHLHIIKEIIDIHPPSVSVRNNQNELPIFILCKRSGKDKEVRESVEYTETIWKLLLAHPETVSV